MTTEAVGMIVMEAEIGNLEQTKILQALADGKYRWRTRRRILEVTGLEPKSLDKSLARLVHDNIVLPAFGKREIVFGLRERVDKK